MNRTKAQQALINIEACRDAVAWVDGQSPVKAWRECKRPDWMLWLVINLSFSSDRYWKRALAASLSVSIDAMLDHGGHVRFGRGATEYARKISTLLDNKGQGKRVRYVATEEEWLWLDINYEVPLAALLKGSIGLLQSLLSVEDDGWLSTMLSSDWNPSNKLRAEFCREIRRVVERPTVADIEKLVL